MSDTSAIDVTGLTKMYGHIGAIDDLDFTVDRGEVFGFLGPNGAGKSTTIDILLGFTRPTSGTATVLGHDVTTDSKRVRANIGVVPDDCDVYDSLTGHEHVELAAQMKGFDTDAEHILSTVGLDDRARSRPAGEYSKGMRQRLFLGLALVGDPDLLILDEPTSGLDPSGIVELRELLEQLTAAGTAIFFSSHNLSEVETVCDRVAILDDGRLLAVDSVRRLRERVGGVEQLKFSLSQPPDDSHLATISVLDGVSEIHTDGRALTVVVTEPTVKAQTVEFVREEADVLDLAIEQSSLEDLFRRYTDSGADSADDKLSNAEREVPA